MTDEKLIWIAKDMEQPKYDPRALISQVPKGSLKYHLFGMINEYFEMSSHIYADVKESLRVFKAKLKFSEG